MEQNPDIKYRKLDMSELKEKLDHEYCADRPKVTINRPIANCGKFVHRLFKDRSGSYYVRYRGHKSYIVGGEVRELRISDTKYYYTLMVNIGY